MERYKHHLRIPQIGAEGQKKISGAKVLIVGLGGLGGPAAQYLTAAGVGQLGLVDDDKVELSNLQRQVLFNENEVGKSKVATAAEKLRRLNSEVEFRTYSERLDGDNIENIAAPYEIIIDGSDNFATKYLLNDYCVLQKKTLIFAAIEGFRGMIGQGCYRCLFPHPPSQNKLTCAEAGVIGALPGIIGAMQALEVIKVITKISPSPQIHHFDFLTFQKQSLRLRPDPECAVCGKRPTIRSISVDTYGSAIPGCRWIDVTEAEKLKNARWIDIRTPEEFAAGHYTDAVNLPQVIFDSEQVPTDRPVVIYCQSGRRCQSVWPQVKDFPLVRFHRLDEAGR